MLADGKRSYLFEEDEEVGGVGVESEFEGEEGIDSCVVQYEEGLESHYKVRMVRRLKWWRGCK